MGLFTALWPTQSSLSSIERLPHVALLEIANNLDGLSFDFLSVTSSTMQRRMKDLRLPHPVKEIDRLHIGKTTTRLKLTPTEPVCMIIAECGPRTLEIYITNDEIITARNEPGKRSIMCQNDRFIVRKIPSDVLIFDDILRTITRNSICLSNSMFPSGRSFRFRDEEINADEKKMQCYEWMWKEREERGISLKGYKSEYWIETTLRH